MDSDNHPLLGSLSEDSFRLKGNLTRGQSEKELLIQVNESKDSFLVCKAVSNTLPGSVSERHVSVKVVAICLRGSCQESLRYEVIRVLPVCRAALHAIHISVQQKTLWQQMAPKSKWLWHLPADKRPWRVQPQCLLPDCFSVGEYRKVTGSNNLPLAKSVNLR